MINLLLSFQLSLFSSINFIHPNDSLKNCDSHFDSLSNQEVYDFADQEPEYPGGVLEMHNFITSNLVYPETAENEELQFSVYVEFIVNIDGSLSGVRISNKNEIDYSSLDKEMIKIVQLMPNWIPGKCNGISVPVLFSIPLHISVRY